MTDTDALVERLNAYRPTNEWGDEVHHVICTEAATALTRQAARVAVLEGVARHYLEDAARWKFNGPGVAAARAALAKEVGDG